MRWSCHPRPRRVAVLPIQTGSWSADLSSPDRCHPSLLYLCTYPPLKRSGILSSDSVSPAAAALRRSSCALLFCRGSSTPPPRRQGSRWMPLHCWCNSSTPPHRLGRRQRHNIDRHDFLNDATGELTAPSARHQHPTPTDDVILPTPKFGIYNFWFPILVMFMLLSLLRWGWWWFIYRKTWILFRNIISLGPYLMYVQNVQLYPHYLLNPILTSVPLCTLTFSLETNMACELRKQ
jgi:hypothetical protein